MLDLVSFYVALALVSSQVMLAPVSSYVTLALVLVVRSYVTLDLVKLFSYASSELGLMYTTSSKLL